MKGRKYRKTKEGKETRVGRGRVEHGRRRKTIEREREERREGQGKGS